MRLSSVVLTCAAGLLLCAPAASANDPCVGTENIMAVCVHPGSLPGVTTEPHEDCLYVLLPECVPVEVPLPVVEGGDGGPVVYTTGNSLDSCLEAVRECLT